MRNIVSNTLEAGRVRTGPMATTHDYGLIGMFKILYPNHRTWLVIVATTGEEGEGEFGLWEHVSVHAIGLDGPRIPTWEEMQYVKELFWKDEETVVQFHPKKSQYVNRNPNVLHLWRHKEIEFILPPMECI